jgi:hypothetical protein
VRCRGFVGGGGLVGGFDLAGEEESGGDVLEEMLVPAGQGSVDGFEGGEAGVEVRR